MVGWFWYLLSVIWSPGNTRCAALCGNAPKTGRTNHNNCAHHTNYGVVYGSGLSMYDFLQSVLKLTKKAFLSYFARFCTSLVF